MHQPRPYGLHAIGLAPTDKDNAFIGNVAVRITNLKELSGVNSLKMVYDLPDGGYVIVQDVGGNFRVITHKPTPSTEVYFDGLASSSIPMFYSGVITKPILFNPIEGVGIKFTEQTRRRLINYDNSVVLPDKVSELQRFKIGYHDNVQEFKPRDGSSQPFRSQYHQLKPTWYSGAMAEAVQIVGAYGKQSLDQLPNNEVERARFVLPPLVRKQVEDELKAVRLPGFTGTPNSEGQISYDYKFNKTNAISFDATNKPWLIQIDASGIWAMPLPIIPATATQAFRQYIEGVQDNEILAILDRFGAMPSGENFPSGEGFDAWRRAGVIIKVCSTSDFYSHISYSTACGWSLNTNGTEGYNTCYNYDDSDGIGYSLTYKLRLDLGSAEQYQGIPQVGLNLSDFKALKVAEYIGVLTSILTSGTSETNAILYKVRRVPFDDIYLRSQANSGDKDSDYWRNLELDPIANHVGRITQVYKGDFYHFTSFEFQPQLKLPEPLLGGCTSHDFLPSQRVEIGDRPNCDTIMFAYYNGNDLKVVKYFIDWRQFQKKTTGNFESNMYVGSWEQESHTGLATIQGYFYSSDIDDRDTVAPVITNSKLIGRDLGYDAVPYFAQDGLGFMCGTIWRNRYYTHEGITSVSTGRNITIGVVVPYFCRNALIVASKDTITNIEISESMKLNTMQDPNTYRYWTLDFVFAYTAMTIKNPKGSPTPKNGSPVWVEEYQYNPNNTNWFADNGSWISNLPANYTWLVHPNSNEWQVSGGGARPYVNEYSKSLPATGSQKGALKIDLDSQVKVLAKQTPYYWYFSGSPNMEGEVFYQDVSMIVFGESKYYSVSEAASSSRTWWGYTKLADHKSAHHFIGVINE